MKYSVNSLVKAISILKYFSPSELELSVAEISQKVRIPISTAYRLIATLLDAGLLDKNVNTGKYCVGHTLYAIGSLYLSSTDIIKIASPVIKTLNELTGEAVSVGILEGDSLVVVMKEETKGAIRIATHVGTVVLAYSSGMGKALLSELTEKEIDRLYPEPRLKPRTKNTIVSKKQLKLELEEIRRIGIAYGREESFEGIESVASVIRDTNGRAVSAMSISVPVFRMTNISRERLATLISMGSNLISFQLGYRDKRNLIRDIEEIVIWWKQESIDSASQENNSTSAMSTNHNGAVEGEQG